MTRAAYFRIAPLDRVVIGERSLRDPVRMEGGWVLHDEGGNAEFVDDQSLSEGLAQGRVKIQAGHFTTAAAVVRKQGRAELLAHVPHPELALVLWRYEFVVRFLRMEAAGQTNRGDAAMTEALKTIQRQVCEMDIAKTAQVNKRAGAPATIRKAPSVRQFRRWLKRFEALGEAPLALRSRTSCRGSRVLVIDAELASLMRHYAVLYSDPTRPTKVQIYRKFVNAVAEINATRPPHLPRLVAPCRTTFLGVIAKLDKFEVHARRYGIAAAKRKFGIVQDGMVVVRPLERVEMDEWRVPLMTIAPSLALHPELAEFLGENRKSMRVWLTVAIDCASRVILALYMSATPSSDTAIAAIEQIVSNKSRLAQEVGAASFWPGGGTPELVVMDQGSSFIADETRRVILDLGAGFDHPPAGLAHLRGRVERMFGSLHTGVIAGIDGRTFLHPVDKGDYDAEANQTLTPQEFQTAAIRSVVDIYHNTPHEGLGGETPLAAWKRLTEEFGLKPPPDRDTRRHIFGVEVNRALTPRGIRFLGLHYQSDDLQTHRRAQEPEQVRVRIDRDDLGAVSVEIDGDWHTVPSVTPGFDGVTASDWIEAARDLARRRGAEAVVPAEIARLAANDIAKLVTDARKRNAIAWTRLNAEDLVRAEAEIRITVETGTTEQAADPILGGGPAGLFENEVPTGRGTPDADAGQSGAPKNDAKPRGGFTIED